MATAREPHVLLLDWKRKPFDKFETMFEEQQSDVIEFKPTLKELVGHVEDPGHDVHEDVFISSKMMLPTTDKLNRYKRQLRIQDVEMHGLIDNGLTAGRGRVYKETIMSFYTMKQPSMDQDWLKYTTHQVDGLGHKTVGC